MAKEKKSGKQNQQREYARVDDHLPLGWRRVPEQEMSDILTHFKKFRVFPAREDALGSVVDSLDLSDKLKQLERADPTLARILGQIDMKLNLLLRLFNPGDKEHPMVPTWVNLSGGGIAFKEEHCDLEVGELLEIRIAFSMDTVASMLFYARIMKIFPPKEEDDDNLSKVACAFEPILDHDREALIQHVFKRQAEALRIKRGL
ncbi:MAG: PilZ domain-containing protein [Magnetococcales bacterium]|nr:PilZ domain-containing protein [Magnetococcales bacterium]